MVETRSLPLEADEGEQEGEGEAPVYAGERIRAVRLLVGSSQADLAASLGITQAQISQIESGRRTATASFLDQVANATPGGDVLHVVARRELGVRDIEKVATPCERPAAFPCRDVRRRILRVPSEHAVGDRDGAISGDGEHPDELLQLRSVVLVEPSCWASWDGPASGLAVRLAVCTVEGQ